jgi:hypothetical protein
LPTIKIEAYEEDEDFQGSIQQVDSWFHLDKIQDKSSSSIGWLLGSTPDSCNINDMKLAHEHHPGLGVECKPRTQAIQLYPGPNTMRFTFMSQAEMSWMPDANITTPLGAPTVLAIP